MDDLEDDEKTQLLGYVAAWAERVTRSPVPIEQGSALPSDDEATGGVLTLSHAALMALQASVDHLRCLAPLLREEEFRYTFVFFTVARSALECSSTAVWLLSPEAQSERVRRRLALASADIHDQQSMHSEVGASNDFTTMLSRELARVRTATGVRGSTNKEEARFSRIVLAAAERFDEPRNYLRVWKGASGFAHGRMWAAVELSALRVVEESAGEEAVVELSPHPARVWSAFGHAVTMTREGWSLLDQRRVLAT